VRKSYEDPVATYATNVMGTVNMLETARHCRDTKAIVNVTSDKCYENRETGQHYRESDPMGGHDPYSSSKGCAELVTAAYRRSFFAGGAGVASGRAGNVIGGGDWAADRLVPDLVRGALKGESTQIRNPTAVRPWQHVLEPLAGYMQLAERLYESPERFAGGWNFGPAEHDCVPVSQVADFVVQRWAGGARWRTDSKAHPHEAKLLALDAGKAREVLGWRPRLPLNEALAWTVDWYKEVAGGGSARTACLRQIEQYMGLR
jgi:CDP-glucose 4,6-dehydratase